MGALDRAVPRPADPGPTEGRGASAWGRAWFGALKAGLWARQRPRNPGGSRQHLAFELLTLPLHRQGLPPTSGSDAEAEGHRLRRRGGPW